MVINTDLMVILFSYNESSFQLMQSLRDVGIQGRPFAKYIRIQHAKQILRMISKSVVDELQCRKKFN